MMTLTEFVSWANGQALLWPGGGKDNRGQCAQLTCYYVDRCWGLPVIWGDAYEAWLNSNQHSDRYDRFRYDGSTHPPVGAVVVWSPSLPGSGGYGHVGILLEDRGNTFVSLDSNWGGAYAHKVTHNWQYVAGWVLPKSEPAVQGDENMAMKDAEFVRNMYRYVGGYEPSDSGIQFQLQHGTPKSLLDGFIQNNDLGIVKRQAALDDMNKAINTLNQTITDLTANDQADAQAIKDAHEKIAELTTQLETAHDQLADANTPNQPAPKAPNLFTAVLAKLLKKRA